MVGLEDAGPPDANGKPVRVGPLDAQPEEDRFVETTRVPGEYLADEASRLAQSLVGLTVAQATAEVELHPGLSIQVFPPGTTAVTLDLRFGRIRVFTDRRGRVVRVMTG